MESKIEELKTFAEKAQYSRNTLRESNISELRTKILMIFDRIHKDTQDDNIFLNLMMGEINQWIWQTKEITSHKYSCFMPKVIDAIPEIERNMKGESDIEEEFKKIKKKVDDLKDE